jgi:hypothetical protein
MERRKGRKMERRRDREMERRKDREMERRKDMIDGKKEGHDRWKEGRT